jgi:hypothetical protein
MKDQWAAISAGIKIFMTIVCKCLEGEKTKGDGETPVWPLMIIGRTDVSQWELDGLVNLMLWNLVVQDRPCSGVLL